MKKAKRLVSKETGEPLELHVIISGNPETRSAKIIKTKFFSEEGCDNPLITNKMMYVVKY